MNRLRLKQGLVLGGSVVLLVQIFATHVVSHDEYLPSPPALSEFPYSIGEWQRTQDLSISPDVQEMLGADDLLNRVYTRSGDRDPSELNLFIAYYKTQSRAKNAHDPKLCLPGSGWTPQVSTIIHVTMPNRGPAAPINYYVVKRGDLKNLVLYWYESYTRSVAREQFLHVDRIIDTIRNNRTDVALVRIIVPLSENKVESSQNLGIHFAQDIYPTLRRYFPPS